MQRTIIEESNQEKSPLVLQLRALFDSVVASELCVDGHAEIISVEECYSVFFSSFTHDKRLGMLVLSLLTNDSCVHWRELLSWCLWAYEQHPDECKDLDSLLRYSPCS